MVGTLVVAVVGGGLLVQRWLEHDARAVASRLTGCPIDQLEVESIASGDVERWRIDGCGTRGTLTCEASDSTCFIVPDE